MRFIYKKAVAKMKFATARFLIKLSYAVIFNNIVHVLIASAGEIDKH